MVGDGDGDGDGCIEEIRMISGGGGEEEMGGMVHGRRGGLRGLGEEELGRER